MNYSIELSPDDLRIIGLALDERPYREVAVLCAKIQRQITDQDEPDEESRLTPAEPDKE